MNKFKYNRNATKDKTILVTGGTGSFGRNFIKKLLIDDDIKKVIVYSRDEQKQYKMSQIYKETDFPKIRYFIGDVRDHERLLLALKDVDIVIHTAAMKHVSIAEYNPFECVKTNILGAQNVISASIQRNVTKVIALSTDKACNPINLYGASKLASDKLFIAGNNLSGFEGTKFTVVRYGNVIGSKGSVIPLFKKLIKSKNGFLPITDDRMTRFWISLQEGIRFVLSTLDQMQGGEIFIPKIPSLKVCDLAKFMAPNLDLKKVGIRPGEKIHEIMISKEDSRQAYDLKDRYVIKSNILEAKKKHNFRLVPEDFEYSSDKNDVWLSLKEFNSLLKETEDLDE